MTLMNDTGLGLAGRLRISRLARGVEQAEIAEALGVARSTVSAWEQGRTEPSATNFVRWAALTGQPLEWLAEGLAAETAEAPTEVEASALLSQHSVRPKGLEPLTFWSVVAGALWECRFCGEVLQSEAGLWAHYAVCPGSSVDEAFWSIVAGCQLDVDAEALNPAGL